MRLRGTLNAAPFGAIISVLLLTVAADSPPAVGLPVRIARIRPCFAGDIRNVVIQVLGRGLIQINGDALPLGDLELRLQEIFRTRAYRFIFVTGEPTLEFGDVAEVIDRAMKQVDHVAILSASVLADGRSHGWSGICLDANLPSDYRRNPLRQ